MFEGNKPWYLRLSHFSLVVSGSLILFGLISSLISLTFSYLAGVLKYKSWVLTLPSWQVLVVISSLTFLLMTGCLYFAENFINNKTDDLEESVGQRMIVVVSAVLFVSVLVVFYFGFSIFLSFLYNNFWI